MILHALSDYYQRKAASPEPELPPPGFQLRDIPFVLVIDRNGSLVEIEDTREAVGRRLKAKTFVLPSDNERSGSRAWERANVLWDHCGYVLGIPKSESAKDVEMAQRQLGSFQRQVEVLGTLQPDHDGLAGVCKFYQTREYSRIPLHPTWIEIARQKGANLTFRLAGDLEPIASRRDLRELLGSIAPGDSGDDPDEAESSQAGESIGRCLVSGELGQLARIHPRTPIPGSKSNAKLVSFQRHCGFDSYGSEQSLNAPVGKRAAFEYTTALRHLSRSDSRTRIPVGDATVVFWAERDTGARAEEAFKDWFDPPADDPDRGTESVRALFEMRKGKPLTSDDEQRFFVLGLAPNAARISVRFWQTSTVRELGERIFRHFENLEMVRGPKDTEFPPLSSLMRSIAVQGKHENVPPNLAGESMRAILAGAPYPVTLLQAAVRRAKAEQRVDYRRASLVKACLNRGFLNEKEKITVSLDPGNTNAAYRLGRFFAVLERIQEEANPGLNATIRDRYFGAASSNPRTVFPILNRLKNHHLAKLENRGRAVNLERLVGEIVDALDGANPFPASLSLVDQGRFAVGYYHQRQHSSTYKSGGKD